MPVVIDWKEIALRLALTVFAGLVIGINREGRGRPAGLRTTLLVCLAASLSMIQANILMKTVGKAQDSFVVLDLMRLPLGILTGMGFIGAGSILRRGSMAVGVTTAATLWFVTVMGLCFGGGQIGLGLAALVIGYATLAGLRRAEDYIHRDQRGRLTITLLRESPTDAEVRHQISSAGCRIISWGIAYMNEQRRIVCEIQSRPREDSPMPPAFVATLRQAGVSELLWEPRGMSGDVDPPPVGTGQTTWAASDGGRRRDGA